MPKRSQVSDRPKDCPSDKVLRLRHRGPDLGSSISVDYLPDLELDGESQRSLEAAVRISDQFAEFDSDERLRRLHPRLIVWKKAFLKINNPVVQANRQLFLGVAKATLPAKTNIKTAKKDYASLGTPNRQQTEIAKTLLSVSNDMLKTLKKALAEDIILSELEAVGFRKYCEANSLDLGAQADLATEWFGTAKPVANTLETICMAVQLLQPVVTEYAKERSTQKGVRNGLTGISFSLCVTLADIGIVPTRSKNGVLCQLLKVWLAYWGLADSSEERAARNGLAQYHKLLGQRELT
ncbi:MAG: hypothetical protein C0473_00940 [Cyanobacteria bacterium DS3.002]|nr:hypothetical protein [Cyanobacteria bacterium DS3.002]MBA4049513.1 hypothetical protein [Cyanobacteria bacterium DS2.008]MBA4076188.1 hypothetical protein [Cyanobacteria bacterium PR.023]